MILKVLSIVGARPQFVKLAPIASALVASGHEHVIVHTGQHYDEQMSDVFFSELNIPAPDFHLGIGSGTHGTQTGAMLSALDPVLSGQLPDWVLIYGDTNSTIAGALSAVKLHLPVAHLEAGLRSFNRRMPEEHNRVLADHASDLLLAPTQVAMDHLATEGLARRSVLVGDVMTDVCYRTRDSVAGRQPPVPADFVATANYLVATIHRPDNTDDPIRLAALLAVLQTMEQPVLLVAHPRLVARAAAFGLVLEQGSVKVVNPLGYPDMVCTILGSQGVITDSGGLQKEAYLLGRLCTTLRTETEWPETLADGWNVLAPDLASVAALAARKIPTAERLQAYGNGDAASRVVEVLATWQAPR